MIEKHQGAAYRPAWQQVAAFVFLEGPGAASYQQSGSLLRKTKFLADKPNLLRLKQTLALCLKPIQHAVGYLHILAGVNALLAIVTIPTGHVESDRLLFIGQCHGAHAAV